MEILFALIIFILAIAFAKNSPKRKGRAGERKVNRKLAKVIGKLHGFKFFHDVTLRTPDGTTQIDHILLSPYGIFVIETKNLTGWIYGDERKKRWTQVVYKNKSTFQNPLHQNYKHVMAVQNLLGVNKWSVFNVVVFAGDAKFKTEMPYNVIRLKKLVGFVRSYTDRIINDADFNKYDSLIQSTIENTSVTDKEHLTNIKRSRASPLCPKCGSSMILRTARKGRNKGSTFFGCSKFPTCRGIKSKS